MSFELIESINCMVNFSQNDNMVFVANNSKKKYYLYDLVSKNKRELTILEESVFSSAFSKDNNKLAILMYNKKGYNLTQIIIIDTQSGNFLKEINLEEYFTDDFVSFTKICWCKGRVVLSFHSSKEKKSVIVVVDTDNNYKINTKDLHNYVIENLFCNEVNIIFMCSDFSTKGFKGYIKSLDCMDLDKDAKLLYKTKNLGNNFRFTMEDQFGSNSSLAIAYKKGLTHVMLRPIKRQLIYKFDVSSETIIPLTKKPLLKKKLIEPQQIFGDTKNFCGVEKKHGFFSYVFFGDENKTFGIYSFSNCKKICDFKIDNQLLSFHTKDKNINVAPPNYKFLKNEVFDSFVFSATGKYILLHTNKKNYIYNTPKDLLEFLKD